MNNKKWRIALVSIFLVVVIAVVVCILIAHKSEDKSRNGEGGVTTSVVDGLITTTEEHIDFTTDDWTSFEFALNNKVYTWPITYSELTADGYVIKYDEDVKLKVVGQKGHATVSLVESPHISESSAGSYFE